MLEDWPLSWSHAFGGGALIGLAAGLMLAVNGRLMGVSGIAAHLWPIRPKETAWRLAFLGGTVVGGALAARLWPQNFATWHGDPKVLRYALSGLIVGFGTQLGRGCTSGHGVCGIGRGSRRSLVATAIFISTGMVTVFLLKAVHL